MSGNHAESEPKTPMWLPALGAVLFLLAGLWWGISSSSSPEQPAGTPSAAASAASSAK